MVKIEPPTCPACNAKMLPTAAPATSGPGRFRCPVCEPPDPLKSDTAVRWLDGLRPPK